MHIYKGKHPPEMGLIPVIVFSAFDIAKRLNRNTYLHSTFPGIVGTTNRGRMGSDVFSKWRNNDDVCSGLLFYVIKPVKKKNQFS